MAIFVDASPLIGLARIGRLDLLTLLPPPISITTAVWDEVTRDVTKPGIAAIQQAAAAGTFSVVLAGNPAEYPFLGRGEAQTLSAARMVGAAVIMDDAEARRFRDNDPALAVAIPSMITTVGLVLLAKRAGAITRVQALLDALMAEQLYVHPAVYEQALRAAGEWPPV